MDSLKFEILLKAVECGSLTHAADELGYTQAGLTHMMNRLENETGVVLLRRTKSGVELTADGERLLPYIKSFIDESEKLENALNAVRNNNEKVIRIAAYASIARNWLPTVISRFSAEYPEVRFEIHDGNIGDIRDMISNNEAEIGFASHDENFKYEWIHLHDDPLMAVLPVKNSLSSPSVPLSYFEGRPFFIPTRGVDYDVLNLIKANGVSPKMSQIALDDAAVVSMVSYGLGCSILSKLVLTGMQGRFVSKPIEPAAYRELGMMIKSKSALPPVAHRFVSYCKGIINEIVNS